MYYPLVSRFPSVKYIEVGAEGGGNGPNNQRAGPLVHGFPSNLRSFREFKEAHHAVAVFCRVRNGLCTDPNLPEKTFSVFQVFNS